VHVATWSISRLSVFVFVFTRIGRCRRGGHCYHYKNSLLSTIWFLVICYSNVCLPWFYCLFHYRNVMWRIDPENAWCRWSDRGTNTGNLCTHHTGWHTCSITLIHTVWVCCWDKRGSLEILSHHDNDHYRVDRGINNSCVSFRGILQFIRPIWHTLSRLVQTRCCPPSEYSTVCVRRSWSTGLCAAFIFSLARWS
jgi:hypothetical protein